MPLPLRFHSLPRQATTRIPTTTGDRPGTRTLRRWTRNLPWTGTLPPNPGPRRLQPAPVQPAPVPAVQAAVPRPAGPVRRWLAPSRPVPTPVPAPTATASLTPIRRRLPEVPTTLGPVQLNRHLGSGWSARKATWAGASPLAGPKTRPTRRLRRRTTSLPPPKYRPPSRSPRLAPALDRTGDSRLRHHLQAVGTPATVIPATATMDGLLRQRNPCGSPSTPWLQLPPLLQSRRCKLHMPRQHRRPPCRRQRHQCPLQFRGRLFLRRRPQRRPTPFGLHSQLPPRQQRHARAFTSACPTAPKQRPGVPRLRPGRLLLLPTSRTYPAPTTRQSKSRACSDVRPWSVFWAGS
jgi:hypothetical protein